jgi:hypothetical protein
VAAVAAGFALQQQQQGVAEHAALSVRVAGQASFLQASVLHFTWASAAAATSAGFALQQQPSALAATAAGPELQTPSTLQAFFSSAQPASEEAGLAAVEAGQAPQQEAQVAAGASAGAATAEVATGAVSVAAFTSATTTAAWTAAAVAVGEGGGQQPAPA